MTYHSLSFAPQYDRGLTSLPERLVGFGFRSWMHGYKSRNFECWLSSWSQFNKVLPPEAARETVSDLAFWVQNIQQLTRRDIRVSELDDEDFNDDERLAITMIAASQEMACPAISACAFALLGDCDAEPVITASNKFASQLLANNLSLPRSSNFAEPSL